MSHGARHGVIPCKMITRTDPVIYFVATKIGIKNETTKFWQSHFHSLFTSEAFHYSLRSQSDRSMSHATRGCDGRQEGCESGYYHLHRYLNNTIRLHNFHCSLFKVQSSKFKVQRLSFVPSRHHRCCCYHPGSGYRHSPQIRSLRHP